MRYEEYLRWGVVGALFAILFVPFIVGDSGMAWTERPFTYIPFFNLFFPYITGKHFIFRILIEVAVLFYILLALKRPEYRPRSSHLFWALGALVLWMGVATIFSVDPVKSFWSNFERMEGYVGLLHLFGLFVVAGAVLSNKLWDRLLTTSVVASCYMGLLALFQIMGWLPISSQSGARADTTFGNATYLAVYMLAHFFLTLYLLSRHGESMRISRAMQAFYGVALVLQGAAIYYTQTRGALVGLLLGVVVAAVYVALRGKGHPARRFAFGLLGAIAILVAAFFALKNTPVVQSSETLKRFADISLSDPTTRARLFNIWPMALQGSFERPVAGWGQENFSYIFNKYYDPDMYNQESWFDRAHNQFLDWLVAGGIPALFLYVSLYILTAIAIWRSTLPLLSQAALFGLLAAFAGNNMLVFDNLGSSLFFFILLAYVHTHSRREVAGSIAFTRPVSDRTIAVVAPFAVLLIFGAGWSINAPALARAQVVTSILSSEPDQALAFFKQTLTTPAWPGTPLGRQEAVEQLMLYAPRAAGSSASPEVKKELVELAYAQGRALLGERKDDARLELFMSTLLSQSGARAEALSYAERALAHSPNKQQILFQVGSLQLESGDNALAIATFKKAYDLAPGYALAAIMYAGAYYYAGNRAEGDKILTAQFGSPIKDDDQLLHTYTMTRQYDRAAAIWELRIENDPQNIEHYARLAEVYLRAGNKVKAIESLRRILTIRPALATQVEQIIKQIESGILTF